MRMLKYFSLLGWVCFFMVVFVVSCGNPTQNNDGLNATILSPTDNQAYSPYVTIDIIFEYDTTKWLTDEGFVWECSKDQGKTWNKIIEIATFGNNHMQLPRSQNDQFHYDVRRWQPVLNGLEENIDIWVRVSVYDGNKSVQKKNIKIRKP